ncbi:puromycin N-acetyltransferase [Gracilaria domingensis]|nr:puromycin N-acetyltransferase [Gracilaria domingensis]
MPTRPAHPPSHPPPNVDAIMAAFANALPNSFVNRPSLVPPHVTQTRPSLPHIPSRRAPHASAPVAERRTIRVHEDAQHIEQLAHTIASAFEVDPVMTHFHAAHEQNVFEKQLIFSRAVLRAELLRPKGQSEVHVADDGACVAIWHLAEHLQVSAMYSIRLLIGLVRCFGLRGFMFAKCMEAAKQSHPSQPHMYLFIIGTHKEQQGKGYGSSVISEMLRRCDQQNLPAYLESSNERNLTFYERHGFKVLQQIEGLPADFPPIYALWRDPQPIDEDV